MLPLIATLLLGPAAFAATDPCKKAQGPVERLVYCQDANGLQRLDRKLNELFAKLGKALPAKQRQRLVDEERGWLARRDSCGDRPLFLAPTPSNLGDDEALDCLIDAYRQRVAELDEAYSEKVPPPSFPFQPKFRETSSDGKIVFFDANLLKQYEAVAVGKEPELGELEVSKVVLAPGGVGSYPKRAVRTCDEFRKAREAGFAPFSNYGYGDATPFLICDLEKVLRGARAPKTKLDEAKLLGRIALSSQFTFPAAPKAESSGVSGSTEAESLSVSVLALSDFDGDGREDALLSVTTGNRGATHWYYGEDVTILGPSATGASLVQLLPSCGVYAPCALGEQPMPPALQAKLARGYFNGGVVGYLLDSPAPLASVTLPKPANDPGPFRVYIAHDGGWFLDGLAPPGAKVELRHPSRKAVIGSISESACLAASDPFGGEAELEGGGKATPRIFPLTDFPYYEKCDRSFGGLGVQTDLNPAAETLVKAVSEGSAAATAGLVPGDILLSVRQAGTKEKVVLKGMTREEISAQLRGPVGSTVTLEVRGPDGRTRSMEITRAKVDPMKIRMPSPPSDPYSLQGRAMPLKDEAAKLFDRVLHKGGTPQEHLRLSELYAKGEGGAPRNVNEAIFWLNNIPGNRDEARKRVHELLVSMIAAADAGDSSAQLSLVQSYQTTIFQEFGPDLLPPLKPKLDACHEAEDLPACLKGQFGKK